MSKRNWKDEEDFWLYAWERDYDKLPRNEARTRDETWYEFGLKKGWVKPVRRRWTTKKEWMKYGKNRGYDKLSRGELSAEDASFYLIGRKKKWLPDFIKTKKFRSWDSKKQFIQYGIDHGYDKLTRPELRDKDGAYLDAGYRNDWIDDILPPRRRRWKSKKEWIRYGKKEGYHKLSRGELRGKDLSYYHVGGQKGWIPSLIPKTIFRRWKSKEHWINYGIKRNFHKLENRTRLREIDQPYYVSGLGHKWLDDLLPQKRITVERWKTKKEWLAYGRQMNYNNLTRTQLQDKDPSFYGKGTRKGWTPSLIPKTQYRTWKKQRKYWSKDEWLEHGKSNGFNKMTRGQLQREQNLYYQVGLRRKWLEGLIPQPVQTIKNVREVEKYVAQNPLARSIVNVASLNQSYGDVADIFTELWPEKFPSSDTLSEQLPLVIPKITASISPILRYEKALGIVYTRMPVQVMPASLEDMLYRIGIDVYQAKFNHDPSGTLRRLVNLQTENKHLPSKKMIDRIYGFYESAYSFRVPGIGSIQQRYIQ